VDTAPRYVDRPLLASPAMATRLKQSIAEFEQAFEEEAELDRRRRESLARTAHLRAATRARKRVHKRGSFRYSLLVLSIILTAVVVTVAMFKTLYVLLG
jgi:hypothetical protein